ncbi:hypothetical protein PTSG_09994 [Salpingoeca rosetta]|uniref:RFX1-4/6/8-like BCD domain-containing protein n=1 Tax=Salpingoeca rosetta (strain ATCC 50818 / BSB-021) TaxID=946362 RepID=F2UP71_SALR5|nr:uncharacterized protein PTSG_09994 [Salpingoeca rosetta]EGD79426.1 hypothetical protein PTSG_09994 [Salpingoeca rosetta]|eukprot:XP_004988907.1 hypothetical protein PTSG_09994 [Salpingoeca rosetta]
MSQHQHQQGYYQPAPQHQQPPGGVDVAHTSGFDFDLSDVRISSSLPLLDNQDFLNFYNTYETQLLELVETNQLDAIGPFWESQWREASRFSRILDTDDGEKYCHVRDTFIFQRMLSIILPDVLQRMQPAVTKSIRSFSKRLQPWMHAAVAALPPRVAHSKIRTTALFAQRLRRYTGLNHLAQAARDLLAKQHQVAAMNEDFVKIDFNAVADQLVSMCPSCAKHTVIQLHEEFQHVLRDAAPLESWCSWLQSVAHTVLSQQQQPGSNGVDLAKPAANLCLSWSFLSSQVIRDLTLRSAATFGMFHLMRLFCDEYMFFLAEHVVSVNTLSNMPRHMRDGGPLRTLGTGPVQQGGMSHH